MRAIFEKIEVLFGLWNWLWKWEIPSFWQLCITSSLKLWKNPLRVLIRMQNCIEFHLHQCKNLQPSPHYWAGLNRTEQNRTEQNRTEQDRTGLSRTAKLYNNSNFAETGETTQQQHNNNATKVKCRGLCLRVRSLKKL